MYYILSCFHNYRFILASARPAVEHRIAKSKGMSNEPRWASWHVDVTGRTSQYRSRGIYHGRWKRQRWISLEDFFMRDPLLIFLKIPFIFFDARGIFRVLFYDAAEKL